jgi:phosphoribosyl 1,2-cyclic phosphate phosphodiesterase
MQQITFLGTGTSQGIPMIGCNCPVCRSSDPRDQRLRTSALVHLDEHNLLIDTTPEFRLQCLRNNIQRVDAVLITHAHADHIFGMDDLRRFNQMQKGPIPVYAGLEHLPILKNVYGYAQTGQATPNIDLPLLDFRQIEGEFSLFDRRMIPLPLPHGRGRVLGYRIGNLAYCTDLSSMPDIVFSQLQGLDLLVLGALRPKPHPAHLSLDQAIELARKINARQTYFIHLSHHISHSHYENLLPERMHLAYDGLTIEIEGTGLISIDPAPSTCRRTHIS